MKGELSTFYTYHSGYCWLLGPSDGRYIGYDVAIHRNQKLILATLGALLQVVLPEFVFADACQDPLILSASHSLPIGFAE